VHRRPRPMHRASGRARCARYTLVRTALALVFEPMPDLVDSIRAEIDARLEELRPLARETSGQGGLAHDAPGGPNERPQRTSRDRRRRPRDRVWLDGRTRRRQAAACVPSRLRSSPPSASARSDIHPTASVGTGTMPRVPGWPQHVPSHAASHRRAHGLRGLSARLARIVQQACDARAVAGMALCR
jgi:hypothetical protein